MNFDQAFEALIDHEKGFTDNPKDPGNWTGGKVGVGQLKGTKYGVSAAAYPGEDIRNLTLTRAKDIYQRDYWWKAGCDLVPDCVKFDLYDTAVNAGPGTAIRMLQRAVGVVDDGVIGPKTMQALGNVDPERLDKRFNGHRLDHLNNLDTWPDFGRGWAQRIAENLMKD